MPSMVTLSLMKEQKYILSPPSLHYFISFIKVSQRLRGLDEQSEIGYLTLFEYYGSCKVGPLI